MPHAHGQQGGFSGNGSAGRTFQTPVPVTAHYILQRELEKQEIRRELEKDEIRREIIAAEMARRRELEEEVMREMASERALGIPVQRGQRFSIPHQFSMPLNIFSGPDPKPQSPSHPQVPTQNDNDQVVVLPRPKVVVQGAKRPILTPPASDEGEHPSLSLQKKLKHEFTCTLCQVSTTSEKGLNAHFQGKKHRAKEASLNPKIGLEGRTETKFCNLHDARKHKQDRIILEGSKS